MKWPALLTALCLQPLLSAQFETEFAPAVTRGLAEPPPTFFQQPGEAMIASDFLGDGAADLHGDTLVLSGSAAVRTYDLIGGEWTLGSTLTANDLSAGDTFGFPLALGAHPNGSGLMLLVGETQADPDPGRVWTFERLPGETTWRKLPAITLDGLSSGAAFGGAIDFDGRYAIVGAPYHLVPNTGSNSPAMVPAGMVCFFTWIRGPNIWVLTTFYQGDENSLLGQSVDIDGEFAVAGAPGTLDHPFGCPSPIICSGQARVYRFVFLVWAEVFDLRTNLGTDLLKPHSSFGQHVAVSGNRIVVTAPLNSVAGTHTGDAFVFEPQGLQNWNIVARLRAASPTPSERFGLGGVAMSGNLIMVGSPLANDQQPESGVVTVFERVPNTPRWQERQEIHPNAGNANGHFGFSIDIDGSRSVISATGVGTQGTVYLYESLKLAPCAAPGNGGALSLVRPTPSARIGSRYDLMIRKPAAAVILFGIIGFDDSHWAGFSLPLDPNSLGPGFFGCDLNASPNRIRSLPLTLGGGVQWSIEIPDRAELVGLEFFMQSLWIDPLTGLIFGGAGASVVSW